MGEEHDGTFGRQAGSGGRWTAAAVVSAGRAAGFPYDPNSAAGY